MNERLDLPTEDELPTDLVFLLTPAPDLCERIDPDELIDYAVKVNRAIDAHFVDRPPASGLEIQVACALGPGGGKLVEVQEFLPDAGLSHVDSLTGLVSGIAVPDVINGPVAFFRRCRFGANPNSDGRLRMPFLQYDRGSGSVLLDDILTLAMPISPPPPTPSQSKWKRWFKRPEEKPKRIVSFVPEDEVVPMLSKQLAKPVIACNGRIVLN